MGDCAICSMESWGWCGKRSMIGSCCCAAGPTWSAPSSCSSRCTKAARRLLSASAAPLLGSTRGSHLVLRPPAAGPRGPLYAPARSDGRPFFILPWREMLLVGTTDIPYEGDPDAVATEPAEVSYLLS